MPVYEGLILASRAAGFFPASNIEETVTNIAAKWKTLHGAYSCTSTSVPVTLAMNGWCCDSDYDNGLPSDFAIMYYESHLTSTLTEKVSPPMLLVGLASTSIAETYRYLQNMEQFIRELCLEYGFFSLNSVDGGSAKQNYSLWIRAVSE